MGADNLYQLTSYQREIWFDQMLHPDAPVYNIGGYVVIESQVDPNFSKKQPTRWQQTMTH